MEENDSYQFNVDLNNFKGPLDLLLDLAKSQKVDLEKISITKLADQFHEFITKASNLNLEIASEYLLMATWLAYLKSKLLLPGTPEEEFKVQEVAEKLKLQLKNLELIRLLSEQMLKRKRLGREIRTRGMRAGIRPIYNSEYKLNLFDLMKTYSTIIMTKDFQRINIPKLPVFTTEEGINQIKSFLSWFSDNNAAISSWLSYSSSSNMTHLSGSVIYFFLKDFLASVLKTSPPPILSLQNLCMVVIDSDSFSVSSFCSTTLSCKVFTVALAKPISNA